ncbi:MAG: hypothetical protein ABIO74_04670 [Dokdonella sp.]
MNRTAVVPLTLAVLLACALCACSPDKPSPQLPGVTASAPANTGKALVVAQKKPTACVLVSAQEMSSILGSEVQAAAHEGSVDKTECIYKPAERVSPYVEITVEWGEGEDAMAAMGTRVHSEPESSNPYAGIGDQSVAIGTALMIRTGKDLVTITFSGVDDAPAKAKMIFATAKPRM